MEPRFSVNRTFTPDQHRECVALNVKHNPSERIERNGLICIYLFAIPFIFLLREPRILSRLLVALPLLVYNLFFITNFRVMFHKEYYENFLLCYSFYENSICVISSNRWEEDISLTYTDISKIIETNDLLLLLNNKDILIALPKDKLSSVEFEGFRTFLEVKTRKRITLIK